MIVAMDEASNMALERTAGSHPLAPRRSLPAFAAFDFMMEKGRLK